MDLVTSIIEALAAGAIASLKDTAGQGVKDAYAALKSMLEHKLTSLQNLTDDPKDEDFRKATAKEMKRKQLETDPVLVEKAHVLALAIEKESPERLAAWGIEISQIKASANVIVKDVESRIAHVTIKDIEAKGGDVRIEGIKLGGLEKN